MPYWLSLDWIIPNWMPLVVSLVLGFILGWLMTGISPARRAREYEARMTELESKYRKADRDLGELRRESEPLRSRALTLQTELDDARTRVRELEVKASALEEERMAPPAAVEEGEQVGEEAADSAVEAALRALAAEAAGPEEAVPEETAIQPVEPELGSEQIAAGFAAVARMPEAPAVPSAKDIALDEAYARVAELQHELQERDRMLRARVAELDAARAELSAANAARHEIENRLIRAREDVASELAVLASTMIKMKDDAIARADARAAALSAELESARSGSAADNALTTAE